MKRYFLSIIIGYIGLFTYNVSFADDWYQVEVVVFEYTHPNRDDIELWDNHPGEPDWRKGEYLMDEESAKAQRKQALQASIPQEGPPTAEQARAAGYEPAPSTRMDVPNQTFVSVEEIITGQTDNPAQMPATPAPEEPIAFVSLPSSEFSLGPVINKLSRQGAYRILSHVAWQQPGVKSNSHETVHITGGTLLDNSREKGPSYEFEALITLKTSRFLHLDVDAILREQRSESIKGNFESASELGLLESFDSSRDKVEIYQTYRLNQSQRIRTNKLYYFDHPLMGVIIKVSPFGG